ncbi:hypothetical protein B0J17DRAFT_717054 [Rhizoctonia solani]|nr:hypothetical protein B0J17DRAFT_717054 [Rhizoctonia solani]
MPESPDISRRLLEIFPPGFDSTSRSVGSRGCYQYAPEQLYHSLTNNYTPYNHVEWTLVSSVWYGKQKKGARHEFILIKVEDTLDGLTNFIVLDRNNSKNSPLRTQDDRGFNLSPGGIGCSQSCQSAAADAFRVSYNGIEAQLLQECQLQNNQYLEMIEFGPEGRLFLYQLVTLVQLVSESSHNYAVVGENCYWFAGVIWECIRALRPSARYDERRARIRGTFARIRYTPDTEHIIKICQEFEQKIQLVEDRLAWLRERWHRMEGFEMTAMGSPLDRRPDPGPGGGSMHFGGNGFNEGVVV